MGNKIEELKAQIRKAQSMFDAAGGDDEKEFAKRKLDRLNSELSALEKEPKKQTKDEDKKVKKTASVEKKPKNKPEKKEKVIKEPKIKKMPKSKKDDGMIIEWKGKTYSPSDPEYCDVLAESVQERKKQQKKSQKKYKTASVNQKIGKDIYHASKHAISYISADAIKNQPKATVNKLQKLIDVSNQYFSALKTIIGDEYDKSEMQEMIEPLKKLIEKIKSQKKK